MTGSSTTTGGVFARSCEGSARPTRTPLVDCCSITAEKLTDSPLLLEAGRQFPSSQLSAGSRCRSFAAVVNVFPRLTVNLTHFPRSSILIRRRRIHYSEASRFHVAFVWLFLQELRDGDIFLAELEHPRPQVVSAVSSVPGRTEPGPGAPATGIFITTANGAASSEVTFGVTKAN